MVGAGATPVNTAVRLVYFLVPGMSLRNHRTCNGALNPITKTRPQHPHLNWPFKRDTTRGRPALLLLPL